MFTKATGTAEDQAARMRGSPPTSPQHMTQSRPLSRISPSVFKNARKKHTNHRATTASGTTDATHATPGHHHTGEEGEITRPATTGASNTHHVMSFADKRKYAKHASHSSSSSSSSLSSMYNMNKHPPIQTEVNPLLLTSTFDDLTHNNNMSSSQWHHSKPSPLYASNSYNEIDNESSMHTTQNQSTQNHLLNESYVGDSPSSNIRKKNQSTIQYTQNTLQRPSTTGRTGRGGIATRSNTQQQHQQQEQQHEHEYDYTPSRSESNMNRKGPTSFPKQDHNATPSIYFSVSGKMRSEYSFKNNGTRYATPYQPSRTNDDGGDSQGDSRGSRTNRSSSIAERTTHARPVSRMTPRALSALAAKQAEEGNSGGNFHRSIWQSKYKKKMSRL